MMDGINQINDENLNITANDTSSTTNAGVLYFGINGFGITWAYFILHIALLLIACTGVALNGLAMHVLKGKTTTATVDISRIFIVNLACSDMITDVTCIYTVIYNLVHYKNYYECAFRSGLVTCMNLNSCLHLLSLTFDRYFKIAFPYRYVHVFKEEWAKKHCACVWIVCLTLSALPVIGWRERAVHGVHYCSYFGVMAHSYVLFIGILFLMTFALMMFCYITIWFVAVKQSRRVASASRTSKTSSSHEDSGGIWWRPTRTVLTLVLFYAFCWLPFGIVAFLHLTDGFSPGFSNDRKGVLAAYSSFFVFLNTIGNPVIYVKRIKAVRIRIMTIFLSPYGKLYARYVASKRRVTTGEESGNAQCQTLQTV